MQRRKFEIMLKKLLRESGMFGKLLFLLFLTLIFMLIGTAISLLLFGASDDINILKHSQLLLSVFIILLPPIVAGYVWYENPIKEYKLDRPPYLDQVFWAIIALLSLGGFINLLSWINEQMVLPEFMSAIEAQFRAMEDEINELTKRMLVAESGGAYLYNLLVIALMPAVAEELFCRGALLRVFSDRMNKNTAVWVVAIIFSLIHFQMYGFLPRMVLGAVLGYLAIWSGSLWLPIIVHFVNNALIVTVYYISGADVLDKIDNFGTGSTWVLGIGSALLAFYLFRKVKQMSTKT